jgi:hypothetical protein
LVSAISVVNAFNTIASNTVLGDDPFGAINIEPIKVVSVRLNVLNDAVVRALYYGHACLPGIGACTGSNEAVDKYVPLAVDIDTIYSSCGGVDCR